jgi:hypothetical protein
LRLFAFGSALALGLGLIGIYEANAKRFTVYGIRHHLPLKTPEQKDKIDQRNYYLRVGQRDGIRKGQMIRVTRELSTLDHLARTQESIEVPVAILQVIHVDTENSIGKLVELRAKKSDPLLDVPTVMVGDSIEVMPQGEALSRYQNRMDKLPVRSLAGGL